VQPAEKALLGSTSASLQAGAGVMGGVRCRAAVMTTKATVYREPGGRHSGVYMALGQATTDLSEQESQLVSDSVNMLP
jgi:hypothetical protein